MAKTFIYRPLSTELPEIRVLELEASRNPDGPLRGKLQHRDRRTADYVALSYAWGRERLDRSMISLKYKAKLGRWSPLYINSNLARALRCLRRKDRSIYLWTDSICINQRDEREKPGQIAMMREIYARAQLVHGWLGPTLDEDVATIRKVHTAFALASRIWKIAQTIHCNRIPSSERGWLETCFAVANISTSMHQDSRELKQEKSYESDDEQEVANSSKWAEFSEELRAKVESDTELTPHLEAFVYLSNVKWFSRIWVLQEYGRSRSLTFHYDSLESCHFPIFLALSLTNSLRQTARFSRAPLVFEEFDKRFLACITARITCIGSISVDEVLKAALSSPPPTHEATDPRDLINARLGLATDGSQHLQAMIRHFLERPNQKKDPSSTRVFASVTRYLLSRGIMDSLIIFKPYQWMLGPPKHLTAPGTRPDIQELAKDWILPSWAYEWSKDGINAFGSFKASGDTQQSAVFIKDPNAVFGEALTLIGLRLGQIEDFSRRFSKFVEEAELGKGAVRHAHLGTNIASLSEDGETRLKANIRTLHDKLGLAPAEADMEKLFAVHSFPLLRFWHWWLSWVLHLQRLCGKTASQQTDNHDRLENVTELLFRSASATLQQDAGTIREVFGSAGNLETLIDLKRWTALFSSPHMHRRSFGIQLAETFFQSAWGMRAAILTTGRLCYVPEDSQVADEVVIFHGVKAPLVLQKEKSGKAFRIIGPTHVSGVMQGELMQTTLSTRKFVLV